MEKIWILILMMAGCFPVPVHAQNKCFTPSEQRKLLNEIDKARTCDTLILNLKQQKDSLIKIISTDKILLEVRKSEIELQKVYVENLIEENRVQEKEIKKQIRRKNIFKLTSALGGIGCLFLWLF